MQNHNKCLLYEWQVISQVARFLTIPELLRTAVLSKQFFYQLKKYLRINILQNEISLNELSSCRNLLYRQLVIMKSQTLETLTIKLNFIPIYVSIGCYYSILQLYDKIFLVTPTNLLHKKDLSQLQLLKLQCEIVVCSGEYIYCASNQYLVRFKTVMNQQYQKQSDNLQLEMPIIRIKCSPTHALIMTGLQNQSTQIYVINHKNFKLINLHLADYHINFTINNQVVNQNGGLILHQQQLYQLNFEQQKSLKPLKWCKKGRFFVKIYNGHNHFIALERLRQPTHKWSTKQVIEWAIQEGFDDYIKIFKIQKVTGKQLLEMDKTYMQQTLGILNQQVQQKIALRLQQCNTQNELECILWGWGRNDQGQLGCNPSNPISNPFKIQLPENSKILKCEGSFTFLINNKTQETMINHVDKITHKFEWKKLSNKNLWSISSYKDTVCWLEPVGTVYIPQNLSQISLSQKKDKLRTVKNIIDQIQWDERLLKQDFIIGYFDKYSGILEIPYIQLHESQIKDYRIEYFKKNNQIVWSKKKRIDIL